MSIPSQHFSQNLCPRPANAGNIELIADTMLNREFGLGNKNLHFKMLLHHTPDGANFMLELTGSRKMTLISRPAFSSASSTPSCLSALSCVTWLP